MFCSTAEKRFLSLSTLVGLTMVAFLALAVIVACVSCGGGSPDNPDRGDTGSNPEVKTTTKNADLTKEMYNSIEQDMTYDQVLDIIGQAPNEAEEVQDKMNTDLTVLKCTWNGKRGSSVYPEDPRLEVYFNKGKVCEKMSTSI